MEYPSNRDHGDYSSNIAMKLSKELGKNPREIAEQIITKWTDIDLVNKPELAGPGFLNFHLKTSWITEQIKKILKEKENYGKQNVGNNEVVVIDMSAPNIAKPMNVGHLRSTIIGDSIKRIYAALGFNAIGDNHLGDWGTQFGKLIYAFKTWGDKKLIEKDPIPELLKLYVRFHEEAEKNPDLEERGREEFSKLEKGDKENRELWKWFIAESMSEFNKIYAQLKVNIEETLGESFYENMLTSAIKLLLDKGIADQNEDGSIAVNFEKHGLDLPSCLIQKKDGSTLYITRDIATIQYRVEHFKATKAIYAVGNEQNLHFRQLFTIARLLGYKLDLEHVGFGLVRLKEGKLSTRKGRVIYLEDLIKEAKERVEKILKERKVDFPEEEMQQLVQTLSIGAIKYNDLSQNRLTEMMFDWDKMLSFEGNSAPYIQYTYARARNILRKAAVSNDDNLGKVTLDLNKEEESLARILVFFPDIIARAAISYKPNILAEYIYVLAQEFNDFYNNVPVLNAPDENTRNTRLALVEAVTIVIKNGLKLLGIDVPERM